MKHRKNLLTNIEVVSEQLSSLIAKYFKNEKKVSSQKLYTQISIILEQTETNVFLEKHIKNPIKNYWNPVKTSFTFSLLVDFPSIIYIL